MKKTFREYHQYSEHEFKKLWDECIFVFDTNTLLNMYRYRRETVDKYFEVLSELKNKNKLWIPHQVGYEFFENRISVISDYEKSYDEILNTLNSAKDSIDKKYKNHPFLDWEEVKTKIDSGLESVIKDINKKKKTHPKLLEQDDILEKINKLFESCVGKCYDDEKLTKIKKDGETRYSKKIPPGFKDAKKDDDKKYGDLILWKQIIDKAIEIKKPVIFISGDVKEDWWLEKDGKRIMPLPQLKKEIFDEAKVDFHIYTADRFLEYYQQKYPKQSIDRMLIDEVRKIRELEEKKMSRARKELLAHKLHKKNMFTHREFDKYFYLYRELRNQLNEFIHVNNDNEYIDELEHLSYLYSIVLEQTFHEATHIELKHLLKKIQNIILKLSESGKIKKNNLDLAESLIFRINKVLKMSDTNLIRDFEL